MPNELQPPNPPLTDGVITLRPFRADDAPAITASCQDPEIERWVPIIPAPYSEADARRFILMTLQAWHDGSSCEFAIADAATDTFMGSIGVHLGPNPRRHAIGYLVAPEFRGRGVATRALKLATRWAFANLEIQRLALWTLPGNTASQAVAEKAGFRYESVARNWEAGRDDQPLDSVVFAMTPEDLADAVAADGTGAGTDVAHADVALLADAGAAPRRRPARAPSPRNPGGAVRGDRGRSPISRPARCAA